MDTRSPLDCSLWMVADIGSGTGNVCRHLVGRVATVFAVEPNDAMRHQAERLLGKYAGFVSVKGTAEETTLPAKSVHLITVGQAFHWFDAEQAEREFDRILKADRWLALIWNRFPEDANSDLSAILPKYLCKQLSFPVTLDENWPRFIGGARSVAHNPSKDDVGYRITAQHVGEIFLSGRQQRLAKKQGAVRRKSRWHSAKTILFLIAAARVFLLR